MTKIKRILESIQNDLLPVTKTGVLAGNHVFGGIVLHGQTLETIVAGSNNRISNPIFHGEIDTIQRFFALKNHPDPKECIFIASHDPCSMCISAIAWSGFKEIWVLFDYTDVSEDFDMPVDILMYQEIFGSEGARSDNRFFRKFSIKDEAEKEENATELLSQIEDISKTYSSFKVIDFDYPGL